MSITAWVYLLGLSLIWGASFYFIEVGLVYLDSFWLVSLRLVTGAMALSAWVLLQGGRLPADIRFWWSAWVMGILNNVIPFSLIAYGQLFVSGGMASILNANTAFMGVILSALFLSSEPAQWNRVLGVGIGIVGVGIVIGLDGNAIGSSQLIGQIAIIAATLSYALAGVWGKIKLSSYPPVAGATAMLICSSVSAIMLSLVFTGLPDTTIAAHPADLLQLVLGIGVLGTACAYPLYFRILEMAGSSNLMLVTIIVPVFAVMLDAILLQQLISLNTLIGFGVVAFGLLILDGRWKKILQ